MMRDERTEVVSTWTDEERDTPREGHVDKRHGVQIDNHRGPRGERPVDKHREVDRELRRIATVRPRRNLEALKAAREVRVPLVALLLGSARLARARSSKQSVKPWPEQDARALAQCSFPSKRSGLREQDVCGLVQVGAVSRL